MTIKSADEFHSLKESEKLPYLDKIGIKGCHELADSQISELTQEINSIIGNMQKKIVDIKKLNCPKEICILIDKILSKYKWANKKIEFTQTSDKQKSIFQYTIFNCELGENIGYEKSKQRPVLILSKNPHLKKIVMVAPITTSKVQNGIPLKHTKFNKIYGYIDLSHIRSIDRSRLSEKSIDRLLFDSEYENIPFENGSPIVPIQKTIEKKFAELI